MNTQLLTVAIIMILAGIASIATSSIAIQAYNKCNSPNLKEEHPNNFNYLVINLVLAILLTLGGFGVAYYARLVPSFSLDAVASNLDKAAGGLFKFQ